MEITKKMIRIKLISTYFLVNLILLYSCKTEEQSFFIYNNSLHKEEKISSKDLKHIKNNIYQYKDRMYIAFEHIRTTYQKDRVLNKKDGLILFDSINHKKTNEIIDLNSYKELKAYFLYIDKQYAYLYSREDCLSYCVKILNVNATKFKVLDDNYEYASDGDNVYCLRYGNTIQTKAPEKFKIIKINNIIFGIDSTHIYSMCEAMPPSYFKDNFEGVPFKIRDSIVRKYFIEEKNRFK